MGIGQLRELMRQQQEGGDRIDVSPPTIRDISEGKGGSDANLLSRLIGQGMEIPTKLIAGAGEKILEESPITGKNILDVINPFTAFGAAQKPITVSEQLNNQSPKTGELLQSYLDREEAKRVEQKEKETTQAIEQIEEKPLSKKEFRESIKSPETQKRIQEGDVRKKAKVNVGSSFKNPENKKDVDDLTGLLNQPVADEVKKDALDTYVSRFMEAMPEYKGKSKFEKGMDLAKLGMAIAAGESPNAIQNISKGFLAMGDTFTEDAKEKRAYEQQIELSASKYALEREAQDIAAERASAAATLDFKRDIFLQNMEDRNQLAIERVKKLSDPGKFEGKEQIKFLQGGGDGSFFEVPIVYDKESPSKRRVLVPDLQAKKFISARNGVDDALDLIGEMRSAAKDIADRGGSLAFANDRLVSIAKAVFPDLNVGKATSEKVYRQNIKAIMGRYKRFLTQETGNGISNYDTKIWEEEIMANPDWFKNYDEADRALQLLEDIFIARRNEIDIGLDFVYDPSNITEDELLKLNKEVGTLSSLRQQEGKIVLQDGKLIRVK